MSSNYPSTLTPSTKVELIYVENTILLYLVISISLCFLVVLCFVIFYYYRKQNYRIAYELHVQKLRKTNAISDYALLLQKQHQFESSSCRVTFSNNIDGENRDTSCDRFHDPELHLGVQPYRVQEDESEYVNNEFEDLSHLSLHSCLSGSNQYKEDVTEAISHSRNTTSPLFKSRVTIENSNDMPIQNSNSQNGILFSTGNLDLVDRERGCKLFTNETLPEFLKTPDGVVYQSDVDIIDWDDLYFYDLTIDGKTATQSQHGEVIDGDNHMIVSENSSGHNFVLLGEGQFGTVLKTKLRLYNGHIAVHNLKSLANSPTPSNGSSSLRQSKSNLSLPYQKVSPPSSPISKASQTGGPSSPTLSQASDDSHMVYSEVDVAVKVIIRQLTSDDYDDKKKKAFEEVYVLQKAHQQMLYREGIAQSFGIALGPMSVQISDVFHMNRGADAIGIVMKYEGGGSLEKYIFAPRILNGIEKIRILENIARGLAEIHALGIVHADIKPENILLSLDNPPKVKLADFGLSMLKQKNNLMRSSLEYTVKFRGTMIYFAPEMLYNSESRQKKEIAKSSKKTDMYAFGILSWVIVSQKEAFTDIENEGQLSVEIHKGTRPKLNCINGDIPPEIISMMKKCWHVDRSVRLTAIECLSLLQKAGPRSKFDIYFSYCPDVPSITKSSKRDEINYLSSSKAKVSMLHRNSTLTEDQKLAAYKTRFCSVAKTIIFHLIRLGYRVYFDDDAEIPTMNDARKSRIQNNIRKSTVVIVFGTSNYQLSASCMHELQYAYEHHHKENMKRQQKQQNLVNDLSGINSSMNSSIIDSVDTSGDPSTKPIITLIGEPDLMSWTNSDFLKYTDLLAKSVVKYADVSDINPEYFMNETALTGESLILLQRFLQPLFKLLKEKNCHPTLNVLDKIAEY